MFLAIIVQSINAPVQKDTILSDCSFMTSYTQPLAVSWLRSDQVEYPSRQTLMEGGDFLGDRNGNLTNQFELQQFPLDTLDKLNGTYKCKVFDSLVMEKPVFSDSITVHLPGMLEYHM